MVNNSGTWLSQLDSLILRLCIKRKRAVVGSGQELVPRQTKGSIICHCDGIMGIGISRGSHNAMRDKLKQWWETIYIYIYREREREKRDKNLPDEFLASVNSRCSSLKCSFDKVNLKNSLILQTRYSENGSKRKKGNGKEAFYSRVWRLQSDRKKHHPCKGGLVNTEVGVGDRPWMWNAWSWHLGPVYLFTKNKGNGNW